MRRIFLDRLRLQASVGILEHELQARQALLISIEVMLKAGATVPPADTVANVFDYRHLREAALAEAQAGHVNMLETLAGRIVQRLLDHDAVHSARVRVDKPSIFTDCDSVAVEVTGHNAQQESTP